MSIQDLNRELSLLLFLNNRGIEYITIVNQSIPLSFLDDIGIITLRTIALETIALETIIFKKSFINYPL